MFTINLSHFKGCNFKHVMYIAIGNYKGYMNSFTCIQLDLGVLAV